MKSFLVFTNILFIAAIIYLLWFRKCKEIESPSHGGDKPCTAVHCKDYSGDMQGLIDFTVAQKMANDYAADAGKFWIGSGPADKTQDARSAWFSLETLKKFIWKIEDTLCKAGCIDKIKTGIRIYYAKYPDSATMKLSPDLAGVKPQFEFHHTVFMVPTFDKGTGDDVKHVDFDPWHMGPDKCNPIPLSAWFKQMKQDQQRQQKEPRKTMFLIMGGGSNSDEQNHGDLMPPPADEGGFPSDSL